MHSNTNNAFANADLVPQAKQLKDKTLPSRLFHQGGTTTEKGSKYSNRSLKHNYP
jgi:hypothetical protein